MSLLFVCTQPCRKKPQGIGAPVQVVHYDCSKAYCCLCKDWHIKIDSFIWNAITRISVFFFFFSSCLQDMITVTITKLFLVIQSIGCIRVMLYSHIYSWYGLFNNTPNTATNNKINNILQITITIILLYSKT